MADIDYAKLSRQQKLAIFLIVVGPVAAAELLKELDDPTIELLCREMATFPVVPETVQQLAIDEFGELLVVSASATLGGLPYAQQAVGLAKGDYKASAIMGRVGPVGALVESEVIKGLREMEGRQIYNLIRSEQPQTIAFLLSYLGTEKSTEVFALLTPELRQEVVERLGTIESTSLELVAKLVRALRKHVEAKAPPAFHRSGGAQSVADLLKKMDRESSKALLAHLEERNAQLGAAIRKKMFSFEDLNLITPADLQRVMREIDSSNLAAAMKSASETIREKIYGAISKRAAESLREEIDLLGPVRLKEVEAAQDAIIQVVRRLEEEGTITLESQGADSLVA